MSKSVSELQVLIFRFESKQYCVDIAHIDEIVDRGELTKLPDSKPHVEDVMDLRGTTTIIVNPKTVLGLDDSGMGNRVIVFETDDQRSVGWLIDEVNQVVRPERNRRGRVRRNRVGSRRRSTGRRVRRLGQTAGYQRLTERASAIRTTDRVQCRVTRRDPPFSSPLCDSAEPQDEGQE